MEKNNSIKIGTHITKLEEQIAEVKVAADALVDVVDKLLETKTFLSLLYGLLVTDIITDPE